MAIGKPLESCTVMKLSLVITAGINFEHWTSMIPHPLFKINTVGANIQGVVVGTWYRVGMGRRSGPGCRR